MEEINLHKLLGEVIEDLSEIIKISGGSVNLRSEEGDLDLVIDSDSAWLYQIFTNLISNALKYAQPGRLPVGSCFSEKGSHQSDYRGDSHRQCRGMSADELSTVFRPFARFAEDVPGSGLGLASVKKLVEQLKGSVLVESAVDSGTTFRVLLSAARMKKKFV